MTVRQGLRHWRYPAFVAVLVLACWSRWWHAGPGARDFPGHVALYTTLRDQLSASLTLPLWTPDWYAGASLVIGYLHPIFSLAALAPFAELFGVETGLRIGSTCYLALAAVAMYAWCVEFAGSRGGAALAAIFYVLHPSVFVFVGGSGHVHQAVSMALAPLVVLAWRRLARAPSLGAAAAATVVSALLFFDMQRFWLVFPFALVVYFAVALSRSQPGAEPAVRAARRPWVGAATIAGGVGVALAVVLCFPALPGLQERALLQWHHPDSIEIYRQRYSFPHLLALLDRDGWLAREIAPLLIGQFVSLPGQWYQGIAPWLFVGGGAVLLARDRGPGQASARGRLAAVLGLWLAALSLAFGSHAVVPRHLELWRTLRAGGLGQGGALRIALLAGLVVLWLGCAVVALRAWSRDRWPARSGALGFALAAAVGVFLFARPFEALAGLVFVYDHIRAPGHFAFPMLGFWLATAASVVTPAWQRRLRGRTRLAGAAAVLLVAVHLADLRPYVASLGYSEPADVVGELQDAFRSLEDRPGGRLLDVRHYNPLANMLGAVTARRQLGWGWLDWSSSRFTSDLVFTGVYGSLDNAARDPDRAAANVARAAELSGLANVRYLSRIASFGPPLPSSPAFVSIWKSDQVELFENARVLPFVQFHPRLALVSGEVREVLPAVARLAQLGVASYTLVPSDDAASGKLPPDLDDADFWFGEHARRIAPPHARNAVDAHALPDSPSNPCEVTQRDATRIALRCRFDRPGYLVVAESWSPSWRATVGERERTPLRLNHAFQGVPVSAGEVAIAFWYEGSSTVRASLWVSTLGWCALLAVLGATTWRART